MSGTCLVLACLGLVVSLSVREAWIETRLRVSVGVLISKFPDRPKVCTGGCA